MFKKCLKCKSIVYPLNGSSNLLCCGDEMVDLIPNSVDASFEKHVPNIKIVNDKIEVVVNHVMDDDHFIEWIALECDDEIVIKKLKPGRKAIVEFDYCRDFRVFAYCNKHGLWTINE